MPQVWGAYEELGIWLGSNTTEAREVVAECGWPRKKSRDDHARTKLPSELARQYMLDYVWEVEQADATDVMVRLLHEVLKQFPPMSTFKSGSQRRNA